MLDFAIWLTSLMIGAALLLNGWRLIVGPSLPDRILALDSLYVNCIALILLLCLYYQTQMYYEAALLIALLGFIGTSAFCKYLLRGDIIE